MESIHELAAHWLVVVTLTITPVKGAPQSMNLGSAPVREYRDCTRLGSLSIGVYDDFRRNFARKKRKFKNIRTFAVTYACKPYLPAV